MKVSSKTVKNWSRYIGLSVIMVKTYIHLPISGVSPQIINLQTIEISRLGQGLFDF